jgi:GT2 family glycosyltransferase
LERVYNKLKNCELKINKDLNDKYLILVVTYNQQPALELFLNNLLPIISKRSDFELVIMDSCSEEAVVDLLKKIKQSNVEVIFHKDNIGKARAVNSFSGERITQYNYPKTIVSIDPDILISEKDLNYLIEATENLENVGMLSMRYNNNGFAPEQNIWFPAVTKIGKNNKKYKVRVPFLCNVAGGVFSIKGEHLVAPLNYIFYPIKYTTAYGPDDAMLSDKFKRIGYTNAYLEGTSALHLKSSVAKSKVLIDYEQKKA